MGKWHGIGAWIAIAGMPALAACAAQPLPLDAALVATSAPAQVPAPTPTGLSGPPRGVLSVAELAQCAGWVETLQTESARLQQQAAAFDARRAELQREVQALQQNGNSQESIDSWARYNSAAAAFNENMNRFREAVTKLDAIKRSYTRQCANRPYRESDIDKLAPAAQAAMRRGLSDVQVPFIQQSPQPGN